MDNKNHYPKIVIVTLPLRERSNEYPPLGSLSVITALKKSGFENTHFYNVDVLRPGYQEILSYLEKEKPDILGISAVVSTSYEFTKNLSLDVRKILPSTTILLGGNLGASAEVLLKKTGVEFICSGEGDKTIVDFVRCWLSAESKSSFKNVSGLCFLDNDGKMVATPYSENISADEVYDVDWSILEDINQMDFFIQRPASPGFYQFNHDPRTQEPHRKTKNMFVMVASKGCVAKCTFCHRWDTGIRYIPVATLMKRIDFFIEKYNVGFIKFSDENFGSDKQWLSEFLKRLKSRDLIWTVSGMRARTVSFALLKEMREAGCCSVNYGLESGSQSMLDVMEKKTSVEQNYSALKWTVENNLDTCLQFVIGMPGETSETIRESAEFASYFAELSPKIDPNNAGINFAQALPGTPLYEYARRKGLIGPTIDDEENYLLSISDRDARDGETNINFTDFPKLVLENWHFELQMVARMAYIKKWGKEAYNNLISKNFTKIPQLRFKTVRPEKEFNSDSGYFAYPRRAKEKLVGMVDRTTSIWWLIKNRVPGLIPMRFPTFFWQFRFFSTLFILPWSAQKYGISTTAAMCFEYLRWKFFRMFSFLKKNTEFDPISLRKTILQNILPPLPADNPEMEKLRKGR